MIFQNNDQDYPPQDNAKYSDCEDCDGTGRTEDDDICPSCLGVGFIEDDDEPDWDNIRDERNEI
jgi:DnaJ-class molecular chaperone